MTNRAFQADQAGFARIRSRLLASFLRYDYVTVLQQMFILPINRDLDTDSRPYALISILALNAVVLVAMYVSGNSTHIYRGYGFIPVHPHLLNLLTSMFLHAGFWHLAGNAWFLWVFGKEVESSVGPGLFVLIYLACGFGGGLLHYALNSSSPVPCVGASGAISGIAGFFFVLFP